MKSIFKKAIVLGAVVVGFTVNAQHKELKNVRAADQTGINIFETPKDTTSTDNNVFVKLSSLLKDALIFGAVMFAPSKQGSTSSPKIHNFENIASFIMKNSTPLL